MLKGDVLSLDAVDDLVESGYARTIGNMIFITQDGRKAAKLSYSGAKKWLKKDKRNNVSGKAGRSRRRNRTRLNTAKDF